MSGKIRNIGTIKLNRSAAKADDFILLIENEPIVESKNELNTS